jgi:hypothetical protein
MKKRGIKLLDFMKMERKLTEVPSCFLFPIVVDTGTNMKRTSKLSNTRKMKF